MSAFCFGVGLGSAETGRGGGGNGTAFWGNGGACGFETATEASALTGKSVTRSGTLDFSWGTGLGELTAFLGGAAFGALPASALGGGTLSTFRSGLDVFSGEAVEDAEIS